METGLLGAITWLVLLGQLAASLYGGYQALKGQDVGAQLLYWLSLTCIPVVSCGLVSYWCAFAVGAFPTLSMSSWNLGANFNFEFGYNARFWLLPELRGLTIGCNLVAISFAVALKRQLRHAGIAAWPLKLGQIA